MAIQFLLPNDLKCIAGLFYEKNPRITVNKKVNKKVLTNWKTCATMSIIIFFNDMYI